MIRLDLTTDEQRIVASMLDETRSKPRKAIAGTDRLDFCYLLVARKAALENVCAAERPEAP